MRIDPTSPMIVDEDILFDTEALGSVAGQRFAAGLSWLLEWIAGLVVTG